MIRNNPLSDFMRAQQMAGYRANTRADVPAFEAPPMPEVRTYNRGDSGASQLRQAEAVRATTSLGSRFMAMVSNTSSGDAMAAVASAAGHAAANTKVAKLARGVTYKAAETVADVAGAAGLAARVTVEHGPTMLQTARSAVFASVHPWKDHADVVSNYCTAAPAAIGDLPVQLPECVTAIVGKIGKVVDCAKAIDTLACSKSSLTEMVCATVSLVEPTGIVSSVGTMAEGYREGNARKFTGGALQAGLSVAIAGVAAGSLPEVAVMMGAKATGSAALKAGGGMMARAGNAHWVGGLTAVRWEVAEQTSPRDPVPATVTVPLRVTVDPAFMERIVAGQD